MKPSGGDEGVGSKDGPEFIGPSKPFMGKIEVSIKTQNHREKGKTICGLYKKENGLARVRVRGRAT